MKTRYESEIYMQRKHIHDLKSKLVSLTTHLVDNQKISITSSGSDLHEGVDSLLTITIEGPEEKRVVSKGEHVKEENVPVVISVQIKKQTTNGNSVREVITPIEDEHVVEEGLEDIEREEERRIKETKSSKLSEKAKQLGSEKSRMEKRHCRCLYY